ncbi:hypothetical protein WK92_15085 [Burkholderia ubonensis]|uniref:tetratricopeptide repeat protein n=1 Tax=Burkholderia ubonensis TaxID=101571 RepID=UPI0007526215|nr:tetratricopeptide repeat protein [Burkholderia ubonensis]KVV48306.1 hypothetical protein WK82_14215 [Burkholderia ubonensis]KVW21753.1 hypothetical protein WK92_15085 [Burkholderia ubonensis]
MTNQAVSHVQVEHIDRLIDRGDLIAVSHLLDLSSASQSSDTGLLVTASRFLCFRGRYVEARTFLDRALECDPSCISALIERARLAVRLADDPGADDWFRQARTAGATSGEWIVDWIDVLLRLDRFDEARNIAATHCERSPTHAGVWFRLGLAHQRARHLLQCLDAYRHAEKLAPTLPMLLNNMAAAHIELNELETAVKLLESALRDNPDNALAWTNLSTAFLKSGLLDDSLVASERACALAPRLPVALQTYSYVLKEMQQWESALAVAQSGAQLDPENPSLVWTVAMLELLLGNYANGWKSHEARWCGSPELRDVNPNLPVPRWAGESLDGKTLLLWGEQGYGDVIQFVRFVPLMANCVKQAGGKLIYCCFDSLLSLFRRGLDGTVETIISHEHRPLPHFDYHLPLCSLPLTLHITMNHLPVAIGYLRPEPARVAAWRERFPAVKRLRVGLAWSGSQTHQRNRLRSIPLSELGKALCGLDEVDFFSLQVGGESDVKDVRGYGLMISDYTNEFGSFDDTAAFIQNLDLVITVCTSIAHLAGAMNVPTWVLLDVSPHWTWMVERRDSPWYPSITLYRQPAYGQWRPVLDRVAHDLAAAVHHQKRNPDTAMMLQPMQTNTA